MKRDLPARAGDWPSLSLLAGLTRDFAPWPPFGSRLVDEIECVASVLLAIAVAHRLGIGNVGWAAFSAYMVLRASFAESLRRGGLRMIGTAVGATLAWLLAPALSSAASLSAALAVCGAAALYLALLERSGYGWLFAGLTFAMVLVDGMEHRGAAPGAFAQARVAEVAVGTCASLLVSAVSALTMRRRLPAVLNEADTETPAVPFCHKAALRHALQGAIALALIPWAWTVFHFQALGQSSITIMVVMMVPMADLAASRYRASTRLRHRFLGGGIGALVATGILIVSHGSHHDSPLVMTLAVCLGLLIGRHIENGPLGISYAGTQFALAFLVVLVPDCHAAINLAPGLERLAGIALGMALLEPVRLLFQQFASPGNRQT